MKKYLLLPVLSLFLAGALPFRLDAETTLTEPTTATDPTAAVTAFLGTYDRWKALNDGLRGLRTFLDANFSTWRDLWRNRK